jgi:uncharacterized protein
MAGGIRGRVKAWVLSDGAAGNRRQALALASALGLDAESKTLSLRWPASWWAPHVGRLADVLDSDGQPLAPPWPDVAIGCGRVAALATRRLREQGVRVAQILDPRIDPARFDVVIAPLHDGLVGSNVVTTLGSLNPVNDAWLDAARSAHADLARLPAPRTAVLVGGPTRHLRWGPRDLDRLIAILRHWQDRDGGSLMLSTSRRTPAWAERRLRQGLGEQAALLHTPSCAGDNPYPGLLAHAARVVVTGDSVNMMSEACAAGVPVLYHAPRPPQGRLGAFHRLLLEHGHIRPLRLEYSPATVAPLREMAGVADKVARYLKP